MSLTLLTQPDPLALSQGGRTTYSFQADARVIGAGTAAVHWLYVQGPVPAGTQFTWRWPGNVIQLTAKAVPTNLNEFPSGDGSIAYVTSLVAYFASYYPFRQDYIAEYYQDALLGRGIRLTARQKGPQWEIISGAVGMTGPGGTVSGLALLSQKGIAPQLRDRYGLLAELWVQPPGGSTDPTTFVKLDARPVEADASGLCTFDVGTLLHSYLQADLPALTGGAASTARLSVCRYFLAYAEAWGQPIQAGKVSSTDVRTALRGGADYLHRAGGGFLLAPFFNGVSPATDRALRPGTALTRFVLPNQPEYLTFVNGRADQPAVSLELALTFNSGTTTLIRKPLGAWALGDKLTLPVGVVQQNLLAAVPAGNGLREYTARLISTGDTTGNGLTQTYRYLLDYASRPYARFFLYQNSLGCPDTLVTWGKGSTELQLVAQQAERSLNSTYAISDGQFVDYDVHLQQQLEVTTGFRPVAELQRFLDFYRSAERYMWLPTGQLGPVSLTSKTVKQAKDGDNLLAHLFTIALRYTDAYSWDDVPVASDPPPPTGFVPGGPVTINTPTVVNAVDATVPQAARDLTALDLIKVRQVAARPDPLSLGLMTEQTAAGLFTPKADTDLNLSKQQAGLSSLQNQILQYVRIRGRAIPKPQ